MEVDVDLFDRQQHNTRVLRKPSMDKATAEEIVKIFTEVVIAPGADEDAIAVFAAKKNLRLLVTDGLANPAAELISLRQVSGGFLVQDKDNGRVAGDDLKIVTRLAPTDSQLADMRFAWTVAKHVKVDAYYAKHGRFRNQPDSPKPDADDQAAAAE